MRARRNVGVAHKNLALVTRRSPRTSGPRDYTVASPAVYLLMVLVKAGYHLLYNYLSDKILN